MGTDAYWQDENGNELDVIVDSKMTFSRILLSREELERTELLKYVDPYGHTIFNQLKLDDLTSDIESAMEWNLTGEQINHLRKLAEMIEKADGHVHTYVKFLGD